MFREHQKKIVYLLILFVPFLLFFVRSSSQSSSKFIPVKMLAGPLSLVSAPISEIKKMLFYHRTFEEYTRLRQEVDALRARLVGQQEVLKENTRLEQLLLFKRKLIYSSVAANVVGRDPTRWNSTVIIDKGSKDGLKVGMPVVNSAGVVGKLAEVGEENSRVILLTDPQFSVAALIQRSRESVLVTGTLDGRCRLRFIDENADIKVGDQVITSKLSDTFPEGLVIGDVVSTDRNINNNIYSSIIAPNVSFSQLEEVLVILK